MFIYYLLGTIAEIMPASVVIDCGGIAYECAASSYTISQLRSGEQAKLYTYCSIREDAFDLYAFSGKEERDCFELLISVNGVGPKAALAILSVASPSSFRLAIASGDERTLTAASGVGKKLAQRILLELKDKIGSDLSVDSGESVTVPLSSVSGALQEASAALSQLGYSQSEISTVLKSLPKDVTDVSDIVRYALRSMVMKG